jgi:hypothetical protein
MLKESSYVKIRVMVPLDHVDAVRQTLGENGAGVQGNYAYCSGSYRQIGRFLPGEKANPAIGSRGLLEEVEEEVVETLCHVDILERVVSAVKKIHPYEEPAIDIIPRLELK